MTRLKILYAGDSPVGGPANYLLGILRFLRADVLHLAPSEPLTPGHLKHRRDIFILSDYSKHRLRPDAERKIIAQVYGGAGLWMIGGWGSFSGPFGHWKGSAIESLLPVNCLARDDRINFPSGAWAIPVANSRNFLNPSWFESPPVLCGLNRFMPKKSSLTLLEARKISGTSKKIKLAPARHPLLVISKNLPYKSCALATDLAPHWSGGLVDWGARRLTLPVTNKIGVEVGNFYVHFVASIVRWLASAERQL